MIKEKLKKVGMDRWFIVASGIFVMVLVFISVFSIVFISRYLFQGLASLDNNTPAAEFNLEGYENLNIPD
jgi:hypothetical protein